MCLIVGATLWMVLSGGDLMQTWAAVKLARWHWLAMGVALMICYTAVEAVQVKIALRTMGSRAAYGHCLQFSAAGFFFSSITPSSTGGQPAEVYYMARRGIPAAHGALCMLLFTIFYQVAEVIYGLVAWILRPDIPASLGTGLGVLLGYGLTVKILLTAGMMALLVWTRPAEVLCRWFLRLCARLHLIKNLAKSEANLDDHMTEYAQGAALIRSKPILPLKMLGLAVVQLGLRFLVPWAVYLALGLSGHGVVEMVSVQALLSLAVGSLPIPGAAGASEMAFSTACAGIFGSDMVTAAMLLSRGLSFYLPVIVTGIATAILHRRVAKRG